LKNERDIAVYTPPGYERNGAPLGLLIVFDGEWYLTLVPTPTILDNMLADRKIPPLVAVFVDNPSRSAELHCNPVFADFLANELVPWIRGRYAVSDDPARTTLTGSSAGGLASTCAALAIRTPATSRSRALLATDDSGSGLVVLREEGPHPYVRSASISTSGASGGRARQPDHFRSTITLVPFGASAEVHFAELTGAEINQRDAWTAHTRSCGDPTTVSFYNELVKALLGQH
jgi:hypothetical protein